MVIGIKSTRKLVGISIIAFCAVFVCTLFLNFSMDLVTIQQQIISEEAMMFYNAQVSTIKIIVMATGCCLLITSIIMLLFYIKHYIDNHKNELGILKALGYSNFKISKNFWVFGTSVFIGSAVGFCGSFLMMPSFYNLQNEDKILPYFSVNFHPSLLLYLVIIPSVIFAFLAVFYACYKLKSPTLALLKGSLQSPKKVKKPKKSKNSDCTFVDELRKNTLKTKKSLTFFIVFASLCFSSMTQMSFSIEEFSSPVMGAMMMIIGIILACTTLFIAITTVIQGNTKTIAMMKVFGYSQKECYKSILGCYRPMTYIGFLIGTIYQYLLMRIMVDIVFMDVGNIPAYEFNFPVMLLSLVSFVAIYEIVMHIYSKKIGKISIKEIMLD